MTDLRALEPTASGARRGSWIGAALRRSRMALGVAATMTAAATLLTACVGGPATGTSSAGGATLHLVAFSVPKEADGAAEKAFAQTPAGQGVTWQESYGASGDQSRAVVNGLQADVVHFSLEPDVTRLVKAGLVDASWRQPSSTTRTCRSRRSRASRAAARSRRRPYRGRSPSRRRYPS